ncbi:MAG TPA: heavy metal translocating P-type ATPase metal-binding domain-containing protein [Candidatus Polarisedimenticolaceae bacterium]|nr:heavy metal translocating P-type ATPase metal-binding domain-containing protein [Candidatus Polarisedimenticolaceae bacterium]
MRAAELSLAAECLHCGLAVPAGREDFCCDGCETVHGVLSAHGLEGYYALARAAGDPRPARVTGRAYEEMDEPSFLGRTTTRLPGGLLAAELYLEGVHCAACVWLVEKAPALVPGVLEVRLDLARSRARVVWDPARAKLSDLAVSLDRLVYPVHPYRGASAAALRRKEQRAILLRIGIAGAIAGNVMAVSFGLYGGLLHGMERSYLDLFRWTALVVAVPSVLGCGAAFFRGAIGALRARSLHMDVPIAVGLLAGLVQGAINTVRGTGEVYFDVVTTLVFLLLTGRYLQARRQGAAAEATELLSSLAPSTARVLEGGSVREVPLEALVPGMRVEVRAGDTVPADGRIEAGRSSLDRSLLTGEPLPVEAGPGDEVHAGTVNLQARLTVEVTSAGEDTRVGRLMRFVEEAAGRRAPIARLADRLAAWFVATVLILAAVTFALWWRVSPQLAFDHAIALLVVTCPCALGLATPLAIAAALGRAARAGYLVRGGDVVETLSGRARIFLDKTGTLTDGRIAVARWWGSDEARRLAAAADSSSAHPVARAIASAAPPAPGIVDVVETTGGGVAGRVGGRRVVIGSPAFVTSHCGRLAEGSLERVRRWSADGLTPVVVAVDGTVAGIAGLADTLRPDARATVEALRDAGFEPVILSGDAPAAVAWTARAVGLTECSARGGITPEEKLALVRAAAASGPVVMVGDGVNDAAALAAATVGIAVQGGAEAAMAAADVYITRPGIGSLLELVEGSRRTMRVVHRNFALSLLYNVAGVALAMSGVLNPIVAAILMPMSSLTVIVSSYRARSFAPPGGASWK